MLFAGAPIGMATAGGYGFSASNPSGTPVTTQSGVSATTPALTLYNPLTSGVYAIILSSQYIFTAAPAAACGVFLAYNLPTAAAPSATTAANIVCNLIGAVDQTNTALTPACSAYRVATLATAPVAFRYLGGTTGAAAIGGYKPNDYPNGEIVLAPGVAISFQTTSAASLLATISWKEVSTKAL